MLFLSFFAILILVIMIAPFGNIFVGGVLSEEEELRIPLLNGEYSVNANASTFGGEDETNQLENLHKASGMLADFIENILIQLSDEICPSKGSDKKKPMEFILLCGSAKSLKNICKNLSKKIEKVGEESGALATIRRTLSGLVDIISRSSILTNKQKGKQLDNKDLPNKDVKKDIEQKQDKIVEENFPSFFVAIREEIFGFMKKLHQYSSSKLIDKMIKKELDNKLAEEIKHKEAHELKQLFLSKVDKLKETNNLQQLAKIVYEIQPIALAVLKRSHQNSITEEVEFVLQVFVANAIFCSKAIEDDKILHIVEGRQNTNTSRARTTKKQ